MIKTGEIIFAVIILLGVMIWATTVLFKKNSGPRRAAFKAARAERDLFEVAIEDIGQVADEYRDIDSVLATKVREILRQLAVDKRKLGKVSE